MGKTVKTLARFATESGKITGPGENPEVKLKLFEPTKDLKLSVFHIDCLTDDEKKEIGIKVVRDKKDAKKLYGWVEFPKEILKTNKLCFEYDDEPPRHGNILGWPEREPDEERIKLSLLRSVSYKKKFDPAIPVKQ